MCVGALTLCTCARLLPHASVPVIGRNPRFSLAFTPPLRLPQTRLLGHHHHAHILSRLCAVVQHISAVNAAVLSPLIDSDLLRIEGMLH